MKELLKHDGINVNAKNKNGRTPLDLARAKNHENIVKLLEEHAQKSAKGISAAVSKHNTAILHRSSASDSGVVTASSSRSLDQSGSGSVERNIVQPAVVHEDVSVLQSLSHLANPSIDKYQNKFTSEYTSEQLLHSSNPHESDCTLSESSDSVDSSVADQFLHPVNLHSSDSFSAVGENRLNSSVSGNTRSHQSTVSQVISSPTAKQHTEGYHNRELVVGIFSPTIALAVSAAAGFFIYDKVIKDKTPVNLSILVVGLLATAVVIGSALYFGLNKLNEKCSEKKPNARLSDPSAEQSTSVTHQASSL